MRSGGSPGEKGIGSKKRQRSPEAFPASDKEDAGSGRKGEKSGGQKTRTKGWKREGEKCTEEARGDPISKIAW